MNIQRYNRLRKIADGGKYNPKNIGGRGFAVNPTYYNTDQMLKYLDTRGKQNKKVVFYIPGWQHGSATHRKAEDYEPLAANGIFTYGWGG